MTVLKLDFDNGAELDEARLSFLLATLQDTVTRRFRHETRRGHHITLELTGTYPPVMVVALQAILGSDPRREIFNVVRAVRLDDAPPFWRHPGRWNTLYASKLQTTENPVMIDPGKFGTGRPALTVEALEGAEAAVWRVSAVEEITVEQDGQQKPKLILTFEEFPDNAYWVNVTGIKSLVAQLGNDEKKWVGKQVPLIAANTNDPRTHKPMRALWVAGADQWEDILSQYRGGSRSRTSRTGVKRAAKKSRR